MTPIDPLAIEAAKRALESCSNESCKDPEHLVARALLEAESVMARTAQRHRETVGALKEAAELVNAWAAYASPYFQDKWGLKEDLAKLEAAIKRAEAAQ